MPPAGTLLHSWHELEAAYRAQSRGALVGKLRRPGSARDVRALERRSGLLPEELGEWFRLHAGTSEPILFNGASWPLWRFLAPLESCAILEKLATRIEPSWVPFAIAESGSVVGYLAIATSGQRGQVVFVDDDRLDVPRPDAGCIDELFARDLERVRRREIVIAGFEDKRPPQILLRTELDALPESEGAFLLPRVTKREAKPRVERDEEGRRFLQVLAESGSITIADPVHVDVLATRLGKILRRRTEPLARATAVLELLRASSGIAVAPVRPSRIAELIQRW
jgi:hypothetical protein